MRQFVIAALMAIGLIALWAAILPAVGGVGGEGERARLDLTLLRRPLAIALPPRL